MKKLLILFLIFILSIFVQLYYLTDCFEYTSSYTDPSTVMIDIEVDIPDYLLQFSNYLENDGTITSLKAPSKKKNLQKALEDGTCTPNDCEPYKKAFDIYVSKFADYMNDECAKRFAQAGIIYVYISKMPSTPPEAKEPDFSLATRSFYYNLYGDPLKRINGQVYVYTALTQVDNIVKLRDLSSEQYFEGWVKEDIIPLQSKPDPSHDFISNLVPEAIPNRQINSEKINNFTRKVIMSDECARLARKLIPRENGKIRSLKSDIDAPVCSEVELEDLLRNELVETVVEAVDAAEAACARRCIAQNKDGSRSRNCPRCVVKNCDASINPNEHCQI